VEHFVATVALIGIVIVVASLLSGIVERVGIPLVGAFLLLGAALGPSGFALIDVQLDSAQLRVLATLGLALVLFSDAVTINVRDLGTRRTLVAVILGPGTLIPAALIALTAWALLGLSVPAAAILGAALASTDPVLLRGVIRAPSLSPVARLTLRLESGMNDVVLLPIVVLATLVLQRGTQVGHVNIGPQLVGLFLLGPALGAAIGWIGILALVTVRTRVGVRRDYESLYALGLGFAAYAAAESAGGSGFLAAFAAGLAIAALDVELCDCFLEYGEATAEMLLLLTFVAFGASLIWSGFEYVSWRTLALALVALFVRTGVLYPVLGQLGVKGRDRRLIALFGPRGLSSLLLVLLPVFAGVPGSEGLFSITCLVVLLSLLIHGTIIGLFLRSSTPAATPRSARTPAVAAPPDGRQPLPTLADTPLSVDRISIAEMQELRARGEPVIVVDARAPRSYEQDPRRAVGSVRVSSEEPVRTAEALRLNQHATLVVYCA
jgi:sodium/hydrogen antiporter